MSKLVKMEFCSLPATPWNFDKEKFLAGDEKQVRLYKDSKTPNRDKTLSYEEIKKEEFNYARIVPKGCCFIDSDNSHEFKRMKEIIIKAKLKCLILETQHGGHFLFRKPDFYKKEMTGATNWFGYKFDTKATTDTVEAVQIIRVCRMNRKEVCSWELDTPITLEELDIEKLDVLPYWLWGNLKDSDLHKGGKTGESEYHLDGTPFTQLMAMKEGGRHDHIFNKCRYFACSNGFEYEEFKSLITAIHDQYLVKIGTPMPDSDLFGDTETKWEEDIEKLESNGWKFEEKERKWKKIKSKKSEKLSKQKACEFLYDKYDFYVIGNTYDTGEGGQLCYIDSTLKIVFDLNIMWEELRNTFYEQDFDTPFYEEVKKQLIQRCNGDKKYFSRSSKYYVCKNGIASCIFDEIYDFDYFKGKKLTPTDLIYDWNLHDRNWVDEHKEDLGGQITKFIQDLSRDSSGTPQPEVEQWLYVIIGASLTYANSLGKIVILSGGGQNGKSLYLALNKMLLGQNFYNEAKIFDSSPTQRYWGDGFDKGICCIIDELPQKYDKEAFSYIKGGVSRTEIIEINPKYGKKKSLAVLPQIICATNHKFELFDKSFGMRRRVVILPCCYQVSDEEKDKSLLYRIVMNLDNSEESDKQIIEYRMNEETQNAGIVIEESGIQIREQCVLDSLEKGSLCWLANKCRYMYIDYISDKLTLSKSEEMESLFDQTFGDDYKSQCKQLINWHIVNKCGTAIDRDLSLANCFISDLFAEHKQNCKTEGIEPMEKKSFDTICGKALKELGYATKRGRKRYVRFI